MNRNNHKNLDGDWAAAAAVARRGPARLTRAHAYNATAEKVCHWWSHFAYAATRVGYPLFDSALGQGAVQHCPLVVAEGPAALDAFEAGLQRGPDAADLFRCPVAGAELDRLMRE